MAVHGNSRLRSDAQRNREHVLRIAHDAFAESGATSLNEIAKRAGVGPGTLYRHFPTREALILAVYQHDIERLVDSVPRVLAANTPLDAFRRWFRTLADYVRVKRGLGDEVQLVGAGIESNGFAAQAKLDAQRVRQVGLAERRGLWLGVGQVGF